MDNLFVEDYLPEDLLPFAFRSLDSCVSGVRMLLNLGDGPCTGSRDMRRRAKN